MRTPLMQIIRRELATMRGNVYWDIARWAGGPLVIAAIHQWSALLEGWPRYLWVDFGVVTLSVGWCLFCQRSSQSKFKRAASEDSGSKAETNKQRIEALLESIKYRLKVATGNVDQSLPMLGYLNALIPKQSQSKSSFQTIHGCENDIISDCKTISFLGAWHAFRDLGTLLDDFNTAVGEYNGAPSEQAAHRILKMSAQIIPEKIAAIERELHSATPNYKLITLPIRAEIKHLETARVDNLLYDRCVSEYRSGKIPIKALVDAGAQHLNANDDLLRLLNDLERFGFANPFSKSPLDVINKADWLKCLRTISSTNLDFSSQKSFFESFCDAALFPPPSSLPDN